MAAEPMQKDTELDTLAFDIFSKRVAAKPATSGEQDAALAYRQAEAFLAIRKKFRAGELKAKEPEGVQLCDCCAPNLPRVHPVNLVAKNYANRRDGVPHPGDLHKVNRILRWLNGNPTPEGDPGQLVARLNREFPELGWDLPTINVARQLFPQYATN